jgi:hypothetical protein
MVRWEMVPRAARAAAVVLSEREWSVLSRRLAGESLAVIAGADMSKQAVDHTEKHAMRKLAQLAGRPVPSINDVLPELRDEPLRGRDVPDYPAFTGGARECKSGLDELADAFVAEAERGTVSKSRRAWYDRRARQLEARQLAE